MNGRLVVRAVAGLSLALVLLAVPLERVAACSCADMPLAEAVSAADAAFVGTLVEVGTEPAPLPAEDAKGVGRPDVLGEPVVYAWQVERSRDADTPATLNVAAAQDDGANCGMTFTADQRWLVVATLEGGMLTTNGCMPNRVIDGVDPEVDAVVSLMVAPADAPAGSDGPLAMAGQLAPIVLGVGLLVFMSVWAFGRERSA